MTTGGVLGSEPGYRLASAGREKAEDERLDLLSRSLIRALATGVT